MKFLAAILAILTLFMTVQPVLSYQSDVAKKESCTADICCLDDNESCERQDNQEHQSDDPNDCCNYGHCNPFEVCACCHYITTERLVFYVSNFIATVKEKFRLANDKVLSSYMQDFWKPPEMTQYNPIV